MTEAITDLARFLARDWTLERWLILHDSGREATVTGSARWSAPPGPPSGHELIYRERGLLRLGGHCAPVSRSYRFVLSSDACADVLFDDGRFFYPLDLRDGRAEVEHLCGDDSYRGVFEAPSPDTLRQRWEVTGPAKDYTSTTVLRVEVDR